MKTRVKISILMCIIMLIQINPVYALDDGLTEISFKEKMKQQERAVAANDCINNGMGFNADGTLDYEDDFAGAKIIEDTESLLRKQRMAIDYDVPVEYKVVEESELLSAEAKGGDYLYNMNTDSEISIGCCGYFRGVPSLATCGHGISGVGNMLRGQDQLEGLVGKVVYHHFADGLSGDYAIISGTNSNYTYTNKIGENYRIKGTITSPAVNTYVYFMEHQPSNIVGA